MHGLLLSLLVCLGADFARREPKLFYDAYLAKNTSNFVGYGSIEENNSGSLVFSHVPVGKYKNAIVYKHELMFKRQEDKAIAHNNLDKTVKIVGQIMAIQGKQYVVVESIIVVDFAQSR